MRSVSVSPASCIPESVRVMGGVGEALERFYSRWACQRTPLAGRPASASTRCLASARPAYLAEKDHGAVPNVAAGGSTAGAASVHVWL